MIRISIIAVAIILAATGVALAWTGSRDSDPGDSIQLPDVRQEDTEASLEPDDDETDDPNDDSIDTTDGLDSADSNDSVDGLDAAASVDDSRDLSTASRDAGLSTDVDSVSSDRSTFKAAPTPTSVVKPAPTTTVSNNSPSETRQPYHDDSVSQYSDDSVSVDSVSNDSR
ncbi:MAG: hypothetical protein GXY46_08875 [Actinobacteria bacterium]|nr:hypothetical protein [Actinomycetota bacterium]